MLKNGIIRASRGRTFGTKFHFYTHTNPPGLKRIDGSFTRLIAKKKRSFICQRHQMFIENIKQRDIRPSRGRTFRQPTISIHIQTRGVWETDL